jgi:hypothetical protein
MITLPRPNLWGCQKCGQPITVWLHGPQMIHDRDDSALVIWPEITSYVCHQCEILAGHAERRNALRMQYAAHFQAWRDIGEPPGTLIVSQAKPGDLTKAETGLSGIFYMLEVENWDDQLPQPSWPYIDGDGNSSLVMLAAYIFHEATPELGLYFHSTWQHPELGLSCELKGWDSPSLKRPAAERLMAALDVLNRFSSGRGRRRGSGRFRSREDCRSAILNAIRALRQQGKPVSQAAVGEFLIASGPRNRTKSYREGDAPSDPARQIRSWCTSFNLDFAELVDEA